MFLNIFDDTNWENRDHYKKEIESTNTRLSLTSEYTLAHNTQKRPIKS